MMSTILDPPISSITTVTLGKRKRERRDSLVIHLSSPAPSCEDDLIYTGSEYEHGQASDYLSEGPSLGVARAKRRYACTFEGCIKAYTKPSRLAEHERSHTGDVRD